MEADILIINFLLWPAELGQCLAARGVAVVYGGGDFGLMGKMAHAVLDSGGDLTGIIPKFFTGTYSGV